MADGTAQPPKFSAEYMDRTVDPRKDFYTYSCGAWLRDNPVPPNKSEWSAFWETYEWNLAQLRGIAEECAADRSAEPGSNRSRVGNFYASAMDMLRINSLKFAPVQDLLDTVSKIGSLDDMKGVIPKLHLAGVDVFFGTESWADAKDSGVYSIYFWQSGISLPDREYYLADQFAELRKQFVEHVHRMFAMGGLDEKQAGELADVVMSIETDIAKASRSAADVRDVEKNYNRVDVAELDLQHPSLGPAAYMKAMGVPSGVRYVVVGQPEFLDALEKMLAQRGIEQWKAYLRWQVIHTFASALHQEARDENFDFFARKLRGQQVPEPEWKKTVARIDYEIGEALGALFVERHFDHETMKKASMLVSDVVAAFRGRLGKVPWMSEETRRNAIDKLDTVDIKLGFPKKFRDYSGLAITPDDFIGNIRRAEEFEVRRLMARIGQKVDRTEWEMTPPTVNAYYEPTKNEIVIPAGIMQPPFFDASLDDAVNYGGIGTVIGHELTHGFDDQGRKFDLNGNMHQWWSEDDIREFDRRSVAVVDAYGAQEVLPGMFVNGRLTLGENIADLGGVVIAYDALAARLGAEPSMGKAIDGLSHEQRFFVAHAQSHRRNITESALKERMVMDPHAPAKCRADIPSMDCPTFDTAFPPKPGEPAQKRIGLW